MAYCRKNHTVYLKVIKQRYLNNIVFFYTFFFFFNLFSRLSFSKKAFSIFSIQADTCTQRDMSTVLEI